MKDAPSITAIAPWFGSKRNLAPRIVAALGKHSAYWEPFCGSMAVLMAKPESSHETVNDLHGDLINMARIIQCPTRGARLYRRLRRVLMTPEQLDSARAALETTDNKEDRAFWYFLESWLGRNGTSGTSSSTLRPYAVRWTPNGGHGGQRLHSAVRSIPQWRRRMRRVTILCMDAFEVLAKIDDHPDVAIYCDPPYLVKGAKYVHDFAADDHRRLADALARFKRARIVVSYYDHPLLAELYPADRWSVERIEVSKAMASQGKRDAANDVRAVECLIVNQSRGLFECG